MFSKRANPPTTASVMGDAALLSDLNLIELHHRIRSLIAGRATEREKELHEAGKTHNEKAANLQITIDELNKAIGFGHSEAKS